MDSPLLKAALAVSAVFLINGAILGGIPIFVLIFIALITPVPLFRYFQTASQRRAAAKRERIDSWFD